MDLVLLGMIGLGALSGWKRGFVLPLLTIAATLYALSTVYTGDVATLLPSGSLALGIGLGVASLTTGIVVRLGSPVIGLIHRVPYLRAGDHTLGVPLGLTTAFIGAYMGLTTLLAIDGFLAPLHGKLDIDAATVSALQKTLAADPQFHTVADPAALDEMAQQVSRVAIPHDQLDRYDKVLAFYEERVRPELLGSRVGPVVVRVGEFIPVLGQKVEYPAK